MEYLAFKASVSMSWFRILNRDNSQVTVNDFLPVFQALGLLTIPCLWILSCLFAHAP